MSHEVQAASDQQLPVVLVNMPFGPLLSPSLGLSLLQGSLRAEGIPSQILYFHLRFAKLTGADLYNRINQGYPLVTDFAGDWLFSQALFEQKPDNAAEYISQVLRRPRPDQGLSWQELEGFVAELLMTRMSASAFVEECVENILRTGASVVGFSSVFQQNVAALAVAQRLKRRRPELVTIFGGANLEGPMGRELFQRFPFIDIVFSGESEQRFPPVVQRLLRGERLGALTGVLAREHLSGGAPFPDLGGTMLRELDRLPVPDYSDYFTQWEALQLDTPLRPYLPFETSRGCWWGQKQHCTFCGLNGASMAYRSKSPQRALSEFTALVQAHPGIQQVAAVDNIMDMKYFKTFIQELGARSNPVDLFYEVKSNLTREQVRLLKAARVLQIQPGIESLSDQVLRLMRKGVSAMHNLQLLKWCKEFGITPLWNVLWGFPREDPAEYARMAELFPLLTHLTPPDRGGTIHLERFSPNFHEAKAHGLKDVRPAPAYSFLYDLPEEALRNIAYFFTYQHEDDRDVWAYARPVSERIAAWVAEHATSGLYALDQQEHLRILDRRKVAPAPEVLLKGAERWALLECDAVSTFDALKARYPAQEPEARGWDSLESVLARLITARLLITDGKSYLGLPITVTQDPFAAAGASP
ncbi:MAG: RiPP maturation radical SAM C-methyltransferase [Myxococcaceae bacterium]|nr:RiPP maturation radical SAM C-methyltransferase [Myxococcaceae bacterium]